MFLRFTKQVDGEPVLIELGQIARVHGRKTPNGTLFTELYVVGGRKPIGVIERIDQVEDAIAAAGMKTVNAGGPSAHLPR